VEGSHWLKCTAKSTASDTKVKLAQMAASWAVLTLKIPLYIMECDKHAPFEEAPNLKPYFLDWALIHYMIMSSTLRIILTS